MTATTFPTTTVRIPPALRRVLTPEEGWLSFVYIAVMVITVAWSIDESTWVLGNGRLTDFLLPMALASVFVGYLTAKAAMGRWAAHATSALIAGIVLPAVVGAVLSPAGGGYLDLVRETAVSARGAWIDLALRNEPFTNEIGHHLLALGILIWATGHFGAYAVFGHHRPLDAFIVVGVVLLGNMALTIIDQLWYLVIFSVAGLLLLSRQHAIEESTLWLRRRIGDPAAVRSLYQGGGTVFVVAAVISSLMLTATASSAPLQGAWGGLETWLIDVSQSLQRLLPLGGASRPAGVAFGPQAAINGVWNPSSSIALRIQVPPTEDEEFYWRAVVYDRFTSRGWSWSETTAIPRDAGMDLLAELPDDPAALGARRPVSVVVEPDDYRGRFAIAPDTPARVSVASQVFLVGDNGRFGAIDVGPGGPSYTITALVPIIGDDNETPGLTQARLRAAGTDYPQDILDRYLELPLDSTGPESELILQEVLALSEGDTPFDIASTMKEYLQTRFEYAPNVQRELEQCGDVSIVECFAITKRGYCQYYASTMAVLLRRANIPTRLVQGFLPGERDDRTGVEVVSNGRAHAWVEVYFPGHGWYAFDPTGGGISQQVPLPTGRPVPTDDGSARPTSTGGGAGPLNPDGRDQIGNPTGGGTLRQRGPSPAVFIVITILLAVVIAGLGFAAWRRGPRGAVTPDSAWRGIAGLAARFGFGPRPTQTVYEYAAALGDVLPTARPELETVAQAKVEVAYGQRILGADRMRALREAHRHLRVALLRLLFRRRERRLHRRR